jgi:hypothetical protein
MEDDEFGNGAHGTRRTSSRRSARNVAGSSNETDTWSHWRGERRSSRLGAPLDTQLDDLPRKRARTEESISSADFGSGRHSSGTPLGDVGSAKIPKVHGAASVKPTEIIMEQIRGKKRSKFWFYAVEPIPGVPDNGSTAPANGAGSSKLNGHTNHGHVESPDEDERLSSNSSSGVDMDIDRNLEGSLSPAPMSP